MAENNFAQNATTDIVIDALMGVTDPAAIATDILLDQLIDALINHYATAAADIEKKSNNYFSKFKDADAKKRADVEAGKLSKDDYTKWRAQKMLVGDNYRHLQKTLTADMVHADQIAADIINNKKCDIYALNHNYGIYEIEHSLGANLSYVLYDHDTVERLIAQNPQVLPKVNIDLKKDIPWNQQKITSAITQGVLQGESIPDISKRLREVTDMDKNAAIRNARTATTNAQNAGRHDSYVRAKAMGIDIEQIWISTLDGRTRHSHRLLMGERRPLGKKFSNGLMFPGDLANATDGSEIYNCRCTLIADVDRTGYGIEDIVNTKLKEKGMTWDEWVNEQPLSKHTGESKAHYLKRYSEYKKKLSFEDWLGEQADPDSEIMSSWGDKKYGYVYNLIKNSTAPGHGADANNFFNALKDLGQKSGIGNPPQVWNAYMTGQLDAEDFNKFETILKKYLPDTSVSSASDVITDAVNAATSAGTSLDNISDAAKKAIADLNLTAGNPMTKIEADTYKVNPMYNNITGDPSHKNCQTATFAYECRRQGYDVVALPKDSSVKDIFDLQDKLGKDQGEGWINKVTGKKPDAVISHGTGTTQSLSEMLNELENAIGKNGERYTLGVKFKSGGAHAVNLDRDENGLLRIIDNQKGAPLKNTWVGKEVEDYFSMKGVEHIRKVYRVDDCVPNPEFFNKIVKQSPTSIVKTSLVKGDDVAKILDDIKDNLLGAPIFNILFDDNWSEYVSIMSKNHSGEGAIDELWQKYLKGDLKDPDLDKLISKMYGLDVIESKKIDVLDVYKAKLSSKYTEIDDSLHKVVEPIIYKNHGDDTLAEYWHKYIKGSITDPELDDALKAHISAKTPQASKTPPIANGAQYGLDMDVISNKSASAVWKELNQAKAGGGKFWSDITAIANKYGEKPGELWKKYYLTGKLDPDDTAKIEAHLAKIYSKTADSVDKVDDALEAFMKKWKGKDLYDNDISVDEMNKIVTHIQSKGIINEGEVEKYFKDWANEKVQDENIAKILGYDKTTNKADDVSDIAKKWQHVDDVFDASIPSAVLDDMAAKGIMDPQDHWKKYLAGEIKDADIDHALKGITPPAKVDKADNFVNPYKGKDLFDIVGDSKLQPGQPAMDHLLDDIGVNWPDHLQKWANGEVIDTKLDELLLGKKVATAPEVNKLDFLKNAYNLTGDKYDIDDVIAKLLDNETAKEIAKENKGSLTTISYLKGYIHGKITDLELDAALGISKTVSNATTSTINVLDAVKNKKVSTIWNELKAEGGGIYSQWWKTVGDIGGSYGKKQSAVWDMYLKGQLKDDEKEKIENFLLKNYLKKTDSVIDYSEFGGKEIYDILKNYDSYKEFLTAPNDDFNTVLAFFSKNKVPGDAVQKAIDEIKVLEKANAAAKAAEKSEELIKAEKKLEKAQDELKAAEEALKKNVDVSEVWDGIWKEDVTLADYAKKKSTIDAKKLWFEEEIDKLQNDPNYKSWLSEEDKITKIWDLQHLYNDLEDFEEAGKKAEAYYNAVEKAKKKITKAQQEVHKFSPGPNVEPNGYSQARKDAAKWPKSRDAANDLYLAHSEQEWKAATATEREAIKHYTESYHKYNEPLRGIQYGSSAYKGVGNTDLNAGSANNGKRLNAMTDYLEKCSSEYDQWLQRGVHFNGMDKFLQIDMNKLRYGTEKELQDALLGKNVTEYGFMSCGSAKGKGFDGDILFNIFTPAGTKMSYAEYYSYFKGGSEVETILQQGSQFIITKVEKTSGQIYIDLEFVGNLPPQRYTK